MVSLFVCVVMSVCNWGGPEGSPTWSPNACKRSMLGLKKGSPQSLGVHNQSWYETNLLSQVTQVCLDSILVPVPHSEHSHRGPSAQRGPGGFSDFME